MGEPVNESTGGGPLSWERDAPPAEKPSPPGRRYPIAALLALVATSFALFCTFMPWGTVVVHGEPVSVLTGNDLALGAALPAELLPEAVRETSAGSEALAVLESTFYRNRVVLWLPHLGALLVIAFVGASRIRPRSRVLFMNVAAFAALSIALAAPIHSVLIIDVFRDFFTLYAAQLGGFIMEGSATEAEARALLGTGIVGPGWGYACSGGGAVAAIACAAGARMSKARS